MQSRADARKLLPAVSRTDEITVAGRDNGDSVGSMKTAEAIQHVLTVLRETDSAPVPN